MSSSSSWLNTIECSASSILSSGNAAVIQWLVFIFLSPCPRRLLFLLIDLLFLFILLVFGIQKLCSRFIFRDNSSSSINKPLLETSKSQFTFTLWFNLSVVVTFLLAITYTMLCILALTQGIKSSSELIEVLFQFVQGLTFAAISVLLVHEKKFKAVVHPISLRLYWIANFMIAALFAICAITRLVSKSEEFDKNMRIDDIFFLVSLPVSAFLFVVAIRGLSGISVMGEPEICTNSVTQLNEPNLMDSNVSGYATASLLSRGTWHWMNPLISKGYKSPLKLDEVPTLPPDHRAERMAELFEMKWPKAGENMKNRVRDTLIRCFWKDFVFTGFLCSV